MLMILEIALTAVTVLIALFAILGASYINRKAKQAAMNVAHSTAQNAANVAMGNFLQPANISGIVEKHINERADEVADLVAEKMADRLYRKGQEQEKKQEQERGNENTPIPPNNENTKENKDV